MSLLLVALLSAAPALQEPAPRVSGAEKQESGTQQTRRAEQIRRGEAEEKPAGAPEEELSREERRRIWWESLPEEKRREYEERRRAFERMTPEQREELRARMEVLRGEMGTVLRGMEPEQRAEYEALDRREQRKMLEDLARERLEARAAELRERIPDVERFEEYRRLRLQDAVRRAQEEGWIGPAAASWLETAPLHEAMATVGEIEKWRFLKKAHEKGWWEKAEVPLEEQRRVVGLPAPEFFRELPALGIRDHLPQRRGRRGPGEGGEGRRSGEDHRRGGEDRRSDHHM